MPKKRAPDSTVLSRILLLHSAIHAQPDDLRMAEVLAAGLVRIPGISGAAVCKDGCLLGASQLELDPPLKCREAFQAAAPNPACPLPCAGADLGCVRLSLQSTRRSYGGVLLKVIDETAFAVYRPFLENTTNLVTLLMENREREADLRALNRSLEQQVQERTARFRQELAERQRAEEAFFELRQRDEEALRVAHMGHWEFDIASGMFIFNDPYYALHGTTTAEMGSERMKVEQFARQFVHPDDNHLVGETIREAIATTNPDFQIQVEARILRVDGEPRWVTVWFRVEKDALGRTIKLHGVNQDITERKLAEMAAAESQAKFRVLFEQANDGMLLVDSETKRFALANRQIQRLLGYSEEEFLQLTVADLHRAADLPMVIEQFEKQVRGEITLASEIPMRRKDGSVFYADVSATMIRLQERRCLLGIFRDITERKRIESALRESENFLTRSQAVARIGSYKFEIATGTWICTPALDEIFGLDNRFPKTTDGWLQLVVPEQRQEMQRHLLQHVVAERNRFEREYRIFRHDDGQERWVFGMGELEFDAQGQPVRMIGTIQDITERKRAEAALRESEERFAVFMENLPAGVFMKEVSGQVLYANRYLCDLFGWENFAGLSTHELLPPELAGKMEADDRAALVNGPTTITESVRDLANRERIFQTSKFPVSREGRPPLLGGIAVDVTERKQAEDALRASLEEKVALLKEVHHRVKNNLQIISSLLNLQARKIQSPEVQVFLRDTQSRIRAMALLHETLYGSGNLARVSFRTYVNSICAHVARSYATDSRNVRLRPEIADVALPMDQAIPAGLIINELVSNSFKHAFADRPEGEITVQLQAAGEDHYALRVADNGVGLPAATDPQTTGTLGLRLVESLVRQLDGELRISCEAGTTFQIVFPRQSA